MYYVFQEMRSKINHLGGRNPCDIEVGGERIFVRTMLYGNLEKKFGVEEGFMGPVLRVERSSRKGKLTGNEICFDFVVLVGIKDSQPKYYVLTKDEFMHASYD